MGQDRPAHRLAFEALIVDLDGVVWVADVPIPGSVAAVSKLRRSGIQILFLTNDPRGARCDYVDRLRRIGIPTREDDVVTAGRALAALIAQREGRGRRVFVIGSDGLKEELRATAEVASTADAVDAVAVGAHEGFTYDELRAGARAVRRGARLYAAGRDSVFPMPDGPWPGTGSIVAAVEVASGKRAVAAGKPEPFIFEMARALLPNGRRVAIVGDNIESDIVGGHQAELETVLVLTGVTTPADVAGARVRPDAVCSDLAALAAARLGDPSERAEPGADAHTRS